MALFQVFLAGFLLSLSLCMDLGVVNIALIRLGLTQGMRAALVFGLGSCIGDMIYALSSLSLVNLLLAHQAVRVALWIGGSAVLLWLAVKMLRESMRAPAEPAMPAPAAPAAVPTDGPGANSQKLGLAREFGRGVMLALSSPTAILWFAAVGGSVIAAHASDRSALWPFFAGFFAAGVLWTIALAALTGYAHRRLSANFTRVLALLSAGLFAYFALVVFVGGYKEFV
jgi:L-lysine exporter family protein LysE/ArgO